MRSRRKGSGGKGKTRGASKGQHPVRPVLHDATEMWAYLHEQEEVRVLRLRGLSVSLLDVLVPEREEVNGARGQLELGAGINGLRRPRRRGRT